MMSVSMVQFHAARLEHLCLQLVVLQGPSSEPSLNRPNPFSALSLLLLPILLVLPPINLTNALDPPSAGRTHNVEPRREREREREKERERKRKRERQREREREKERVTVSESARAREIESDRARERKREKEREETRARDIER